MDRPRARHLRPHARPIPDQPGLPKPTRPPRLELPRNNLRRVRRRTDNNMHMVRPNRDRIDTPPPPIRMFHDRSFDNTTPPRIEHKRILSHRPTRRRKAFIVASQSIATNQIVLIIDRPARSPMKPDPVGRPGQKVRQHPHHPSLPTNTTKSPSRKRGDLPPLQASSHPPPFIPLRVPRRHRNAISP